MLSLPGYALEAFRNPKHEARNPKQTRIRFCCGNRWKGRAKLPLSRYGNRDAARQEPRPPTTTFRNRNELPKNCNVRNPPAADCPALIPQPGRPSQIVGPVRAVSAFPPCGRGSPTGGIRAYLRPSFVRRWLRPPAVLGSYAACVHLVLSTNGDGATRRARRPRRSRYDCRFDTRRRTASLRVLPCFLRVLRVGFAVRRIAAKGRVKV